MEQSTPRVPDVAMLLGVACVCVAGAAPRRSGCITWRTALGALGPRWHLCVGLELSVRQVGRPRHGGIVLQIQDTRCVTRVALP